MAARKKKATKKRVSKKRSVKRASASGFKPPRNFQVMDLSSGDFAQVHDFEAEPVLEGKVISLRDVPKGGNVRKDTRIMTVQIKGGELRSVWESTRLSPLFNHVAKKKKGQTHKVWIHFLGFVKIKGRRQDMKDFEVAIA